MITLDTNRITFDTNLVTCDGYAAPGGALVCRITVLPALSAVPAVRAAVQAVIRINEAAA